METFRRGWHELPVNRTRTLEPLEHMVVWDWGVWKRQNVHTMSHVHRAGWGTAGSVGSLQCARTQGQLLILAQTCTRY